MRPRRLLAYVSDGRAKPRHETSGGLLDPSRCGRRRRRAAQGCARPSRRKRLGVDVAVVSKLHPDAVALRLCGGRHQRRAGQRDRGLAGDPHLRHRQGLRLPGRPGRDRDHVPRGAAATSSSSSTWARSSRASRTAGWPSARSARPARPRTVYSADITGHVLIHVLYEQLVKYDVQVYEEFFATKVVVDEGRCAGVIAWDLVRGGLHAIEAKHVIIATGGMGRMYYGTTNAFSCTGDGMALAWRAGVPLKDMEFMQFHPTTLKANGVLITEGCRGEGGVPAQRQRRALHGQGRAQRDGARVARRRVAARSGRRSRTGSGVDGCVLLDLTHLGAEKIKTRAARLPRAGAGLRRRRLHRRADPRAPRRPLPDGRHRRGRLGRDDRARAVGRRRGRLRVGARREPPRRQLADGDHHVRPPRRAGHRAAGARERRPRARASTAAVLADEDRRIAAILNATTGPRPWELRDRLAKTMYDKAGVFRTDETMQRGARDDRRAARAGAVAATGRPRLARSTPTSPPRSSCSTMLECADCLVTGGAGAPGEPRRALAPRLPRARRRALDEAHRSRWHDDGEVRLDYKPVTVTEVPAPRPELLSMSEIYNAHLTTLQSAPTPSRRWRRRCACAGRTRVAPTATRAYTVEVPVTATVLDALDVDQGPARRHARLPQELPHGGVRLVRHARRRRRGARLQDVDEAVRRRRATSPTVAPMGNMPVIKDLVVDMEPTSGARCGRSSRTSTRPRRGLAGETRVARRGPEQQEQIHKESLCIMCGCCVSECNSMEADPGLPRAGGAREGLPLRRRRARPRHPRAAARPQRRARHLGLHALLLLQPALPEGRRPARCDRQARRGECSTRASCATRARSTPACSSTRRTAAATCARRSWCRRRIGADRRAARGAARARPGPRRQGAEPASHRTRRRTTTRCAALEAARARGRSSVRASAPCAPADAPRRTERVQDRYAYYPGCLASLSQKELDSSTRAIAQQLEVELIDMPSVTCCGAGDIHEAKPDYYLHLSARILGQAERTGADGAADDLQRLHAQPAPGQQAPAGGRAELARVNDNLRRGRRRDRTTAASRCGTSCGRSRTARATSASSRSPCAASRA